jgi:hypothetical protein
MNASCSHLLEINMARFTCLALMVALAWTPTATVAQQVPVKGLKSGESALQNPGKSQPPSVAQRSLLEQVQNAPPLPLESVCQPLSSVRFDAPWLVPNPDGRSYDLLLGYYKNYQGPAPAWEATMIFSAAQMALFGCCI